jgi:outer membrane protein assembly factor BamB
MQRPLRLWPGSAAAAIVIAGVLVTAALPVAAEYSLIATAVGVFAIILWWLSFSRAPWLERVGALLLMVGTMAAVRPLIHASVAGGAQGGLQYVLSMLPMSLLLVAWAAGTRHLSPLVRRASMAVAILAGGAFIALLRTDGIGGATMFELRWRWTPTAEERLLAEAKDDPITPPARPAAIAEPVAPAATSPETVATEPAAVAEAAVPARKPAEWPGFRGPARNGIVPGVKIVSDWSASPPTELWRRRIGPGWSSFAVDGDLIYTQEQRGDDEIVACYRLSTGEPVWRHRDAARFYESNGGAGPRGTPTLSNGMVYAFGATGVLNALDARTGAVRWSRNAAADTKEETPVWGFSSSPLVVADVVVVATGGTLAGYDRATGAPRWLGLHHGFSYSSPHLVTIDSVAQVLLLAPPGVFSVSPSDGTMLWEHTWEGGGIVQPAVTPDGDILVSGLAGAGGSGVRRLAVRREGGTWTVQERWTSNGLKPYFNDYVVHNGHAFGFDGSILSSIELATGTRKWKGGRYGAGQLVLLPDQDLLLVLSEEGGLALVSARPDKYTEIARAPAIEGKTWNHPVLVGDVLIVRNGEEMAAFRLALAR